MCDLYKNIEKLCQSKGINIATLAAETGLVKSTFSDLKRGKTKFLSLEKLVIVADYFDISLDRLVGRKRNAPVEFSTEAMKELFDLCNIMSESQQALFVSIAKELILQGQSKA